MKIVTDFPPLILEETLKALYINVIIQIEIITIRVSSTTAIVISNEEISVGSPMLRYFHKKYSPSLFIDFENPNSAASK